MGFNSAFKGLIVEGKSKGKFVPEEILGSVVTAALILT